MLLIFVSIAFTVAICASAINASWIFFVVDFTHLLG